jgi:hypothetical protein
MNRAVQRDRSSLLGMRFGRLTVLRQMSSRKGHRTWLCLCDCGGSTAPTTGWLRSGHTKSCGCLSADAIAARNRRGTIHRDHRLAAHGSWEAMMTRCTNKRQWSYQFYGARGIRPCAAVALSSSTIVDLIGDRPDGQSLDRANNAYGYTCGRCIECVAQGWPMNLQWASRKEQAVNRTNVIFVAHEGRKFCLSDWARRLGVKPATMIARYRMGQRGVDLLRGPGVRRNSV